MMVVGSTIVESAPVYDQRRGIHQIRQEQVIIVRNERTLQNRAQEWVDEMSRTMTIVG